VPDELDLVRSFRSDIPGPSTDAWARARAAVAEASVAPERNSFGVGAGRRLHYSIGRGGKFRTIFVVGGVAVLALVATAMAATLSGSPLRPVHTTGTAAENAGGSLRLASYSFPLPEGFRLTSTSSTLPACFPVVVLPAPAIFSGTPPVEANPYSDAQVSSAASADGGCIFMAMTVSYNLGAGGSDPYELPGGVPISMGSYAGWTVSGGYGHGGLLTELAVRIPSGDGQYRDLVAGTIGLPISTVESLVEQGLSS
jgi:hypothetical protein